MHTFANGGDPDEMPQHAAFHLGLHCLLTKRQPSEKEVQCTILFLYYNM